MEGNHLHGSSQGLWMGLEREQEEDGMGLGGIWWDWVGLVGIWWDWAGSNGVWWDWVRSDGI